MVQAGFLNLCYIPPDLDSFPLINHLTVFTWNAGGSALIMFGTAN